ncbi:MAG: putative porin [Bacteroidales bacterium]|nr:putative porin [Bacteroidales bacterium]
MKRLPLYLLFFTLYLPFAMAQEGAIHSIAMDSTAVYLFRNTIDSTDFPLFVRYDSTLTGIEKRSNPAWDNAAFADLGNIGQAQKNMLFGYQRPSGFHYKQIPYHSYTQNTTNPVYFRSLLPYSEVYYLIGAKKEQDVGLNFSRNLYRGLTLGILFDLTFSPGAFPNQRASTSDISVSLRYFTPTYRYGVIGAFSHYKVQANENGGIASDSLFETSQLRPEAIPVNLTTGSTTVRNYGFEVTQYFHLSKPLSAQKTKKQDGNLPSNNPLDSLMEDYVTDTLQHAIDTLQHFTDSLQYVTDSLQFIDDQEFNRKRFNWGRLSLRTKMSDLSWLYDNGTLPPDFFPNYYNDSLKTHDSTRYFIFENTFSYSNANINSQQKDYQFRYYLSLTHQYTQIQSIPQKYAYDTMAMRNSTVFYYNQLIPKVQILTRLFRTFELRASGDYVLNGYNKDDFSLSGSIGNTFGKGDNATDLRLGITTASQMPDWFYGYYNGNHYRWENSCDKVNYFIFSGELSNRLFDLKGEYFLLSNYMYLNREALPEAAEDIQNVLKISLKSKVKVGKYWIFDNFLAYQNTFNSAVIRLPDFLYNGTVYFQMSLAKNALILAPGISLFYNTAYFADAYTPALNSFYLQEEMKTGNYLYADFFVDVNIKYARIFVKYRHFSNPLLQNTEMGNKYYMIPHYPQVGGGVYAGVSWRFIN